MDLGDAKGHGNDPLLLRFSVIKWIAVLPFIAMFFLPYVVYGGNLEWTLIVNGEFIQEIVVPHSLMLKALGLVLLWLLLVLLIAVPMVKVFKKLPASSPVSFSKHYNIFLLLVVVGLGVFFFHTIFIVSAVFENLLHQLSVVSYIALGMGIALLRNPGDNSVAKLWLTGALVMVLYVALTFVPLLFGKAYGAALTGIVVVGSLFVLRAGWRTNVLVIIIASLLLLSAMTFKTAIRQEVLDGQQFQRIDLTSKTDRIGSRKYKLGSIESTDVMGFIGKDIEPFTKFDQNSKYFVFDKNLTGEFVNYSLLRTFHRMNHLGIFTLAIDKTPEEVPYLGVGLYKSIFYSLIPRALWSGKPTLNTTNNFGRTYGILWPDDFVTSVNVDPLTEAWIAGGFKAVLATGIGAGVIFGLLYGWLVRGGNQAIRYCFYIILLVYMPGIESGLVGMMSGLLQSLFVFFVLLVFPYLVIRYLQNKRVSFAG
ncbi:MAG: hypothetical protein ABW082_06845 [Sedimenticola sp.]